MIYNVSIQKSEDTSQKYGVTTFDRFKIIKARVRVVGAVYPRARDPESHRRVSGVHNFKLL